MTDPAQPAEPRCVTCLRRIPAWDQPRLACTDCQTRTATRLGELPGLYYALDPERRPPASAATGSRHHHSASRPPLNLHILDLTGPRGILPLLDSWARCWAADGALTLPDWWGNNGQTPADALCGWLRWHLDWAARQHPAIGEAIDEIASAHRAVRAAAGEDAPAVRRLQCPCGGVIHWQLDRDSYHCPGCGARYGREEAAELPAAPRRRAIAA